MLRDLVVSAACALLVIGEFHGRRFHPSFDLLVLDRGGSDLRIEAHNHALQDVFHLRSFRRGPAAIGKSVICNIHRAP